jgi:thiamine transport system ATP-binding protein
VPHLVLEGVDFRYEDMEMSFSLRVESGECLAILGPSGGGKSTLLALIAGFERPLSGRVLIDGADVTGLPPASRPVSLLFQEHNLFAHLSVFDNVAIGVHPGLRLDEEGRARVTGALNAVGLEGLERRLPAELSGGERQRVALARSLVRERPLLLLDEPFAALGPAQRRDMMTLVDQLRATHRLTVLFVTHQPEDAWHWAPRTAFVYNGKIIAVDDTRRLFVARTVPEIDDYLGWMHFGEGTPGRG